MMDLFGDYNTDLDVRGAFGITVPAGETQSVDWTSPGLRYFTGIKYHKEGGGKFDTATIQVIHPATGAVVKQFATNVYIYADGGYDFYKAVIPAGMVLRFILTNSGSEEATFSANLILHKDRTF